MQLPDVALLSWPRSLTRRPTEASTDPSQLPAPSRSKYTSTAPSDVIPEPRFSGHQETRRSAALNELSSPTVAFPTVPAVYMPSRFSTAFRRKSSQALNDFDDHQPAPAEHRSSFRVLERPNPSAGPSFDGGAHMMSRPAHKPTSSEPYIGDNLFAGLNRGSGGSNTTKGTSTDTSSRHSNASTAPSSADAAQNQDDPRGGLRLRTQDPPARQPPKSSGGFLDRAGRTFSFGIQKKNSPVEPKDRAGYDMPPVPPVPTLQREDENGRTRAMTASTTSTATPPKLEGGTELDLGGDFSSMFSKFGKRASTATLRTDEHIETQARPAQPHFLNTNHHGSSSAMRDPSPTSMSSLSDDNPADSSHAPFLSQPSSAPRHQPSFEYRSSTSPGGPVQDDDAKFLADSVAATRFLSDDRSEPKRTIAGAFRGDESMFRTAPRKPVPAAAPAAPSDPDNEENMFAGTPARFSRPAFQRAVHPPKAAEPPRGSKVMTTAEFEKYQREKERQHLEKVAYGGGSTSDDEDDEDEIDYDDDDDEEEKQKQQARQRRHKQAEMLAYRQKNMKTTGNPGQESPLSSSRPSLPAASLSAPQLSLSKTIPTANTSHSSEEEDEEVPLAILQAHGFPSKNRSSTRLSTVGSMANLSAAAQASSPRPASAVGDYSSNARRASTLPAFARNLPQDPFVGASVSRPALRESLSFAGGNPAPGSPQLPQQQPMHPGGLVGVIASEERSRAIRRGTPHVDARLGSAHGIDPITGIPSHSMYGGGAQGIQRMPQAPAMSPADHAQIHMSQQMTQFMQMQMQFMQMMAENQGQGQGMPFQMSPQMQQMQMQQMQQMQMQQQHPHGGLSTSHSSADLSGQFMAGGQGLAVPRRMDAGMRTMSMVQPSGSNPFNSTPYGRPGSAAGAGYTPSIAPSERSNVGLPGRYRPVSQASGLLGQHQRSASMSGSLSLSQNDDTKSRSTIRVTKKANAGSDDDDEEGWEAMRAKREQKRSLWRRKKATDVF